MTGARFLSAFLLLPGIGAFAVLSRRLRWMPHGAALAVATLTGAFVLCAEMFALTVVGVRWRVGLLLVGPAVAAVVALRRRDGSPRPRTGRPLGRASVLLLGLAGAALLLVAYAALTARITSSDLLLFWAHKGERFALARGIDAAYLARPDRVSLQSDYPPLWPCLYGFATLLAGRFAWGASLATLPLSLALMVVAVWSFSRRSLGSLEAAAAAAAFAAVFGFLLSQCMTAGNADPPLLFCETVALCLLVFARDEPGAFPLAGIALAGAAWLKLEGIVFGWAVIAATALLSRPVSWKRLRDLALPPIVAYLSWVAFCASHGLIAHLGTHRLVLTGERFRTIAVGMSSVADLGCSYLPWIVAGAVCSIRRPGRSAAIPVAVAVLVAAFDCGIYFAATADPTLWIGWAGARTLLTPLLALLIAALAPARSPAPVASAP